jgi:ribosome assembly protein 1
MGRGLEAVEKVPAGNIFGIGGVSKYILKSATIASSPYAPIFSAMYFQAAPIMRFSLEPQNLSDMKKLVKGLKLLNQSDPSVEVYIQETGEHVIVTAGEVHAERCLRDLNDKFAKVPIHISAPLVNFKETIIEDTSGQKKASKVIVAQTANKQLTIKIKVVPLPENISHFIDENRDRLKRIFSSDASITGEEAMNGILLSSTSTTAVLDELRNEFEQAGPKWTKEFANLWSLGPKHVGPNILLNHVKDYNSSPYFKSLATRIKSKITNLESETSILEPIPKLPDVDADVSNSSTQLISLMNKYDSNFIAGFQLATSAGPLCDEPMYGVCFSVEDVQLSGNSSDHFEDTYGPFGGQIMSAVKEGCRKAFNSQERRLVEAMYKCDIQATNETVGNVYGVLRKRRAKVIADDVEEGTGLFIISAYLPVAESFGFIDELRNKTSGAASPQLVFSHWAVLEVDPFYVPKTEEELEEFGEQGNTALPNIAKQYIDQVRKRKGLMLDKKIVENAEKQRNLSRNK